MERLFFLIVLFSCSNNTSNKTELRRQLEETSISTNDTLIHGLDIGKYINLSNIPIDTLSETNCGVYKVNSVNDRVPGPTDYYLIATFKIRSIDSASFKKINTLPIPLEKNSYYFKSWLPQNVVSDLFSKKTFKPKSVYSINVFSKSPFKEGFFILLEDSTVYLQMETK